MTLSGRSSALAGLVGEAEASRLQKQSFGRDLWRTRIAAHAAAALFDWARLNAVLAEHRLEPPRLRLERKGVPVTPRLWRARGGAPGRVLDPAPFLAELRAGATLILDAASELSGPLQALCAGLSAEFTCFCQANLYACWGETQGFDVHWDDHDVFVVQVEGRKRWALYGATRSAPVVQGDPPDHVAPTAPREQRVLEPGDVIYLPRGYWHAAQGIGEPSLHLTIGLTRRTGSEFLHWLADHLLSDARVRTDLPFEQGDAAVADQMTELLADVGRLEPKGLAGLYRRQVESSLAQRPLLSLPRLGGPKTRLSPGDRIRMSYGAARLEPGPAEDSVLLSWRGVRFTVSSALEAPLGELVAGGSLTVSAFEAAAGEQSAGFIGEMLARGVFVLDPAAN